ncbi:MAG: PssE/Cps14G family polysaccharide biosynthesis glycosyltransferase [Candidatus Thorarchaeota archaeon]|jgi:beta-1,4-N-acetylglucosaminyltransferase
MIFVTVGTAYYDPLIKEIDRLVGSGEVVDTVVAQIGRGKYEPVNIPFFRFIKSLKSAYDSADLIVSTGGAGTTLECVTRGLRLVVVENRTLMEGHQAQLIGEMSRRGHLLWCVDVNALGECIETARASTFTPFVSDTPHMHEMIVQLLEE